MPNAKRPTDPGQQAGARDHLFLINLLLIGAVGVGFCGWTIAYTNWFPAIGGLLALSGAFSWIAFVSGVISDERRKPVQALIERIFLDNLIITVVYLILVVAGAWYALGTGSIEIVSLQDVPALVTWYPDANAAKADTLVVDSRGAVRRHVRTGYGNARRKVKLLVQGLPELTYALRPLERHSVKIPYSFMRPVLLLRPTPDLYASVAKNPETLHVKVRGAERVLTGFKGQAVWIGSTTGIEVPLFLRDDWASEVAASPFAHQLMKLWTFPEPLPQQPLQLSPGDVVKAWLTDEDGVKSNEQQYMVRRVAQPRDFPQVEDF